MKKIYEITKYVSENVLAIGVDEKIVDILDKNKRIKNCDLLNAIDKKSNQKGTAKTGKIKRIKIKKLRKIYKNKKIDFIICNIDSIKKYLKTFIKDSVYINKDMLYIYGICDNELTEDIIRKYKRYNVKLELINDNDEVIIKIDNKNSKTNIIKDFLYLLWDNLIEFINIIGDILVN